MINVKYAIITLLFLPVSISASAQQFDTPIEIQPINQIGDGYVDLAQCFTMLISDIDVPAQESGPLIAMTVREGESVQESQEIAKINDQLAQLRLKTAQTKLATANEKAKNDVDIRAAENALHIAEREKNTNYGLFVKGALPEQDYERFVLAAKQAALKLEQAQKDNQTAIKEAQVEEHNVTAMTEAIARHLIKSPIDGNVLEIYKEAGEWVNAGDNVVRIARLDRLYVQGLLDSSLFNPAEVEGRRVTVTATLARGEQFQFQGRIVYVALEKNSSRYYSVRAEVQNQVSENRWQLLSGEEVSMRIHLNDNDISRNHGGEFNR